MIFSTTDLTDDTDLIKDHEWHGLDEFLMLFRWGFVGEGDVVVVADVGEGFTTESFGLEVAAKLGKLFATGTKITVESGIRYVGQSGQF